MDITGSRDEFPALPRTAFEPLRLFALLLVLAFAFQGSRGIYDADEGRYTDIALNMVENGDYLIPHLDTDHPHYSKPPLTYWMLAASFRLAGVNEWSARLPSALAFVATGMLIGWMALRLGFRHPWRAGWIWGLTLAPLLAANVINSDTLLTCFETLAVSGFVAAETASDQPTAARWRILMWCGLGLAFLTKGPPGLIPLLGIGFAATLAGWRGMARLGSLPGMVLASVIGLSWYVYVAAHQRGLANYFIGFEVVDRIFTAAHHRNPGLSGLLITYLPMALLGSLPWSGMLAWRRYGPRRARIAAAAPAPAGGPLTRRLALGWCIAGGVIFLLAQSRLPLYLLPLFVPFALWTASKLDHVADFFAGRRAVWLCAWATGLLGLKLLAAFLPSPHDGRTFAHQLLQLVHGRPVSTWLFVDTTPRFDLHLYTGHEAELASLAQRQPPFALERGLCAELAESPDQVVLTLKAEGERSRRALEGCKRRFVLAGTANKYSVYVAPR